jgi:hypothetical protein
MNSLDEENKLDENIKEELAAMCEGFVQPGFIGAFSANNIPHAREKPCTEVR